ncbi:MAG: hypothetical protein ACYCUV_15055, partial [Phycisphaerae bacterium]
MRRRVITVMLAACAVTTTWGLAHAQGPGSAQHLMAGQLIDDARTVSRNLHLPANIAAKQALILLEEAQSVDGQSATALRLLAEAAQANGNHQLRAQALQKLV